MRPLVRLDLEGGVARLTLNDPTRLNAISYRMTQEFNQALDAAERGARALILTGEGRAFCSGAAVTEMDAWPPDALRTVLNPLLTRLRDFKLPVVTVMNGLAVGFACSLALLGDIILAAENSYFLFAFSQVGLVPDGNASFLLPRLVGRVRSAELMLLGERLPINTALAWGLVNRVLPGPELQPEALRIAQKLASGPASFAATRRLLWRGLEDDWQHHLEAEAVEQEVAQRTEDHREGVAAFKEKRRPRFTGR
jgi:2-(1,2-epoxy-1,2-dihydrophenyl)acetyl-CoA isomerase